MITCTDINNHVIMLVSFTVGKPLGFGKVFI